MAPYAEQVILCTGKEDWASNIEQEEGATGDFVSGLKGVIGKGAEAFDVRTRSSPSPKDPRNPELTKPSPSTISL
jgi:hypothetical protein